VCRLLLSTQALPGWSGVGKAQCGIDVFILNVGIALLRFCEYVRSLRSMQLFERLNKLMSNKAYLYIQCTREPMQTPRITNRGAFSTFINEKRSACLAGVFLGQTGGGKYSLLRRLFFFGGEGLPLTDAAQFAMHCDARRFVGLTSDTEIGD
jgi:hypothetical protein